MRFNILIAILLGFLCLNPVLASQDIKSIDNAISYNQEFTTIYTKMVEIHGELDGQEQVYLDYFSNEQTQEELEEAHSLFSFGIIKEFEALKIDIQAMPKLNIGKSEEFQWMKKIPEYFDAMEVSIASHLGMVAELYEAAFANEAETFNAVFDNSIYHSADIIRFENMYIESSILSADKNQPQVGLSKSSIAFNEFIIAFLDYTMLVRDEVAIDAQEFEVRFEKIFDTQKAAINLAKRKMRNFRSAVRRVNKADDRKSKAAWPYMYEIGKSYKKSITTEEDLMTTFIPYSQKLVKLNSQSEGFIDNFQILANELDVLMLPLVTDRLTEHNNRQTLAKKMIETQR